MPLLLPKLVSADYMDRIKAIAEFYLKPLVIIQLLVLVIFIVYGCYFEEYEGFLSTTVAGIYTKPAKLGWDTDVYFMLFYIIMWLVKFAGNYNLYGIVLVFNIWLALTLAGAVLYRILKVNVPGKSVILFIILFIIISVDNIVNLNTTRLAFIYIAAIAGYIESRRFENKAITTLESIFLSLAVIYASLIRFDAVLLFSLVYLVLLFVHKRYTRLVLIPLLISGGVYTLYHVITDRYSSKEKKVLIYKEREIFDRYNIDYDKLSPVHKLDVDAILQYCITDKEHFSVPFYDSISRYKFKGGIGTFLNGLHSFSLKITWMLSRDNFWAARYFFIFYCITGLFYLFRQTPARARYVLQYIFLGMFPFLLCFYTVVPLRFLIPFLSAAGCLNVFMAVKGKQNYNAVVVCCAAVLFLILYEARKEKTVYEIKAREYHALTTQLMQLDRTQNGTETIVINSVYPLNYFPVKPFDKLYRQHAVFLNFYLYSADDYQIRTWKELCHCNTFSLKERTDYVVSHQNLFLIDNKAYDFMTRYFSAKYHVRLKRLNVRRFNEDLNVCRLSYTSLNSGE
jgi:hypothetical protein